uniref:ribosomal protein S14 n=1 Tax=Cuminum cyminum TaxID=52462 RepID=UPI0023F39A14|nr:ribosomal protein S14 [Cuminum cyminum]WDV16680.1 ribosomal protein S14 [Cuminum cyminum]
MSEKLNIRDHKRIVLAAKYELRRKLSKAFCKDPDLSSEMRDKRRSKLSKLPRKSSFARVRNRCISTGRPRSVYEFFRISRSVFRGLASRGALMGIKKASWAMEGFRLPVGGGVGSSIPDLNGPPPEAPPQPAEDVYYEKEPDRIKAILGRKKAEKDASAVSNRKALRSSLK